MATNEEATPQAKEEPVAALKRDGHLAEEAIALRQATEAATPERDRSAGLEWAKVISPPIMVIVTAVTAYFCVNRHAQIVADQELALKKFEVETTLRYGIIKDYLALPNQTSRNRFDMLTVIEKTDDRASVRSWAEARRQDLQKDLHSLAANDANLRNALGGARALRPVAPGDSILICKVTVPAVAGLPEKTVQSSTPSRQGWTEESAKVQCQRLSTAECGERKLDPAKCPFQFEIVPPSAPGGATTPSAAPP